MKIKTLEWLQENLTKFHVYIAVIAISIIGVLHLPRHIYVWLIAGVYIMTAIFLYGYFKTSNLFFGIMSIFLAIGCYGGSLLVLMFYRVGHF